MAAAAAVLGGCGQTVQCAPCPPPVFLNLLEADGSPLTPASDNAAARVCVERLPCEEVTTSADYVPLHVEPAPRQLDGRAVSVTVLGRDGAASLSGRGVLEYRRGGDPCGCTTAHANVRVTRDPALPLSRG